MRGCCATRHLPRPSTHDKIVLAGGQVAAYGRRRGRLAELCRGAPAPPTETTLILGGRGTTPRERLLFACKQASRVRLVRRTSPASSLIVSIQRGGCGGNTVEYNVLPGGVERGETSQEHGKSVVRDGKDEVWCLGMDCITAPSSLAGEQAYG